MYVLKWCNSENPKPLLYFHYSKKIFIWQYSMTKYMGFVANVSICNFTFAIQFTRSKNRVGKVFRLNIQLTLCHIPHLINDI